MPYDFLPAANQRLSPAQRIIIDETLRGRDIHDSCRLAGIAPATYTRWTRLHSDFRICLWHVLALGIELDSVGGHKPDTWPDAAQGKMPEVIPMSWYRRQDYARLRQLMADGHLLPASYDAWLARSESLFARYRDARLPIVKVTIDPYHFVPFCEAFSIPLDAAARLAFATGWLTRRSNPHQLSDFGLAFEIVGHELIWANRERAGLDSRFGSIIERLSDSHIEVLLALACGDGDLDAVLAAVGTGKDIFLYEWCANADFVAMLLHSLSLREETNLAGDSMRRFDYSDHEAPRTMTFSWYRVQDYDRLRKLSADGQNLPADYEAWLAGAEATYDSYADAGFPVQKVVLDLTVYPNWCARKGLRLDALSRILYAADAVTSSRPAARRN